jgi:hypothetical protein
MTDWDFRECPLAAVDTAYPVTQKGADTPGPIIAPENGYITAIRIFVSGIVTDVVTGTSFMINLKGLTGNQWYAGPLLSCAGAAATSGGFDFRRGQLYKTRIPVKQGDAISIDAFANGEDAGTAHILVNLEFNGEPGKITEADCREDDIGAAANTLVSLTHRGAAVDEGDFRTNGKPICEILFGAALDPTGDAANGLVFAPALELSGNGLMKQGNYAFVGPSGPTQPDTDVSGGQQVVTELERYIGTIPTKNGSIRARAQNIESINPGHAMICLCFA